MEINSTYGEFHVRAGGDEKLKNYFAWPNLKYFLNHWCVHTPLSHMRLCLPFSILPLYSVKVGDHFDMLLGY